MIQSAERTGKLPEDPLLLSETPIAINRDLDMTNDESVNFNLTSTQIGLSDSINKTGGKLQQTLMQKSQKLGNGQVLQASINSRVSRDSGMSSGNFCFAADNMVQQASEMKERCERLEQDKSRLTGQVNQMLKNYREMELKYEVQNKISEADEEGLASTYKDLVSMVGNLER